MLSPTRKKPLPDFIIRLVGNDVKPWLVPLRTLGNVLSAVQRLVDQRDDLVDGDEGSKPLATLEPEGPKTLHLIDVKAQSAGYAVRSPNREATLSILRETGRAIEAPERAIWNPSRIASIEELSATARALGCVIEFRELGKSHRLGDVIAKIRPETASDVTVRAFERGRTSVVGRLERVGGASECRCGIHVRGRARMLFCDVVSESLAREMGKHLYTNVVLSGQAVWYRSNRQLKSLNVTSFSPAKIESFTTVAEKVRAAGADVWDRIKDPTAYLSEMRGQ